MDTARLAEVMQSPRLAAYFADQGGRILAGAEMFSVGAFPDFPDE